MFPFLNKTTTTMCLEGIPEKKVKGGSISSFQPQGKERESGSSSITLTISSCPASFLSFFFLF